jgi:preprotein translocase subunit SecG
VSFANYLNVAEIVISSALIFVILLQAKGSGFGGALGGSSTFYHTRRGSEKTLFQLTIVLIVVFILISAWSVTST